MTAATAPSRRRTWTVLAASTALFLGSLTVASGAIAAPGNGNSGSAPGQSTAMDSPIPSSGNGNSNNAPGHNATADANGSNPQPEVSPGTQIDTQHPDKQGNGNTTVKDQSPGASGKHKVTICHHTGNAGWILVTVDATAWDKGHNPGSHQDDKDYVVSAETTSCGGETTFYNATGYFCSAGSESSWTTPANTYTSQTLADAARATHFGDTNWRTTSGQVDCSDINDDCPTCSTLAGEAPLAATVASETTIAPQAATVKPQPAKIKPQLATVPKAAKAGDGSSLPASNPALLLLLGLGALGTIGSGLRLVATRR